MSWYPRPPYPNDIIAGYLLSSGTGGTGRDLTDATGSGTTLDQTFSWQIDSGTTYELLFGPFTYFAMSNADRGCAMQLQFNLTDGAGYDVTLGNNFIMSVTEIYVRSFSRWFSTDVSGATLTASFTIQRRIGSGTAAIRYGRSDDATIFGVRAIGKLDDAFTDAEGKVHLQGIQTIGV